MKQTILSKLEEIYRSVPAEITDDDEVIRWIAMRILFTDSPDWYATIESGRAE